MNNSSTLILTLVLTSANITAARHVIGIYGPREICAPLLKRVLTKIIPVISTSNSKQDEGSNSTDDRNRLSTLVTKGQKPSRGENITTIHGHSSCERLNDSGSLQGSIYGVNNNSADEADHKQGKWSNIYVRHEVASEHITASVSMRNL